MGKIKTKDLTVQKIESGKFKKELPEIYSLQNNLENKGYVTMFEEKIAAVKQVCSNAKTVLDYGCGEDMVLKSLLVNHGYEEVDGYDPNYFSEQHLKSEYDLIISTEAFEHFREPRNEMEKIASLLGPSGYVAIMTQFYPGATAASPSADKFSSWYYKRDPTHVAFYCAETFAWIALHLGFQIVFNNQKDFVVLQSVSSQKE